MCQSGVEVDVLWSMGIEILPTPSLEELEKGKFELS